MIENGLYDLDEYLKRTTEGDERPEVSVQKAIEWLAEVEVTRPELISTIKLFESLGHLTNENTCNAKGYDIIRDYNSASQGLAKYGMRKVDRVAFKYFIEHAKLCSQQYVYSFNKIMGSLDSTHQRRVEKFVKSMTERAIAKTKFSTINPNAGFNYALESIPIEFIRLMSDITRDAKEEAADTRQILKELSGVRSLPIDHHWLEMMFDDYIYEPCEYFVDRIGRDIYEPFMQDHETLMDLRRTDQRRQNQLEAPKTFYESLAYAKACRMYVLDVDKSKLIDTMLMLGARTS